MKFFLQILLFVTIGTSCSQLVQKDKDKNLENDKNNEVSEVSRPNTEEKKIENSISKSEPADNITFSDLIDLKKYCFDELKKLPGPVDIKDLKSACDKVSILKNCKSQNNEPIFHYSKESNDPKGKRVLTLALIHGDEFPSGSVARAWMSRLENLNPRNSWRVIPILNPDGVKLKTRTNARGVDLNRNFPTVGWEEEALFRWKKNKKEDPRRFPGEKPASESETLCAIEQIEDFKPDFIISVHTPLGVLDFDGPKLKAPKFEPLPWISLGHFPGSLGRYMWKDRNVPVLTIELKGSSGIQKLELFDRLQDISGTVAIQADKARGS